MIPQIFTFIAQDNRSEIMEIVANKPEILNARCLTVHRLDRPIMIHDVKDAAQKELEDGRVHYMTSLDFAAALGLTKTLAYFIRWKEKYDRVVDGGALLIHAAEFGQEQVARYLHSDMASVHIQNDRADSALHAVSLSDNEIIARMLIDAGAMTNLGNVFERMPIHEAARRGSLKVARVLAGATENIAKTDSLGKTPLDYARESRNLSLVALLEEYAEAVK